MKNLTLALACASTFALFAEIKAPTAGFEKYAVGDKVSGMVEPDSQYTYWLYEGASGSDDGSTVKAYGGENLAAPTTGDAAGDKYLELSTEGGTLWRSFAEVKTEGSGTLGEAQALPAGGLYIDTMVQFTPTEDGGEPETAPDDKLAIWLNVDSSGGTPVTNLMVKSAFYYLPDGEETITSREQTYRLSGTYEPGVWYRLTVEAIKTLTTPSGQDGGIWLPGFQIRVDGKLLTTSERVCDDGAFDYLTVDVIDGEAVAPYVDAAGKGLLTARTFIPSIVGYQNSDKSALQAVGFKGSGALDNLAFSETEPQPTPGPEFAVDWGTGDVTAVWGATPPTAAELAAIQAWATANGLSATQVSGETGAAAYLLGLTTVPSEVPALSITSIDQTAGGWTVTVACSAQSDLSKVNGKLTVKTATSLGEAWVVQTYDTSNLAFADGKAVITVTADTARFMKAALTR
mgnify:CR=1 FL=1